MSPAIIPELFNSYVELHTAQLGVLVGLFVGLLYRDKPYLAYALLFMAVLPALGKAPDIGYAGGIAVKPWYFLSALYISTAVNILLVMYSPSPKTVVRRAIRLVPRVHRGATEETASPDNRS
jgi:hypothetical protein